jgi:hypothetical protein
LKIKIRLNNNSSFVSSLVSDLLALPKRSDTTPLLTRILPDAHPKRVERGAAAGKAQNWFYFSLIAHHPVDLDREIVVNAV